MKYCIRCIVSGHVQGVFYRGTTARQAKKLALVGHAINLPDGRVEVFSCGEKASLELLKSWLWQGPEYATVSDVQCEVIEQSKLPTEFITG